MFFVLHSCHICKWGKGIFRSRGGVSTHFQGLPIFRVRSLGKICFCGQITSKDCTGCSLACAFPCCIQTWGKVLSHSAYKHVRRQRRSPTSLPFFFNKTTSLTQTGSRYVPVLGCMVEVNPYPSWGHSPLLTTPCLRLVFTIQPYLTRHWLPYLTLELIIFKWGEAICNFK